MSSVTTNRSGDSLKQRLPSKLFGYDVIDLIGHGAASTIYAVDDPRTRQLYALKHVVPTGEKEIRFVEQLETEFEVGRHVNHVGLRKSIDLKINRTMMRKVTEGALVLELFDGVPLDQELPKTVLGIIDVFVQVSEALESLHAQGIIHADMKPNNILVGADGQVKVIDLGQACKSGTAKPRIQGTPDFIAPEQVKCQGLTVQTDVFNFGATLYWALCGKKVPTLYNLKKTENSFLFDEKFPAPRELCPHVPETLSHLVMDCVRTNPAKRPHTMHDVTHRLAIMQHLMRKAESGGQASQAGTRVV